MAYSQAIKSPASSLRAQTSHNIFDEGSQEQFKVAENTKADGGLDDE